LKGPAAVFVLSDGIRGHENQSLGIASWLADFGAFVEVFRIPRLQGFRRFQSLKVASRSLVSRDPGRCRKWLLSSGGEDLLGETERSVREAELDARNTLFLSAGSSTAPFCLALAGTLGVKCCTVMTPSVLGVKPFDLSVVPEHDRPETSDKVLATLGAPNRIRPELLDRAKEELRRRFPPLRQNRWAFLVGGDDRNYHIGPEWAAVVAEKIIEAAEKAGADLYITTSRRTLPETGKALEAAVRDRENVRMLLLASKDDWNPVPGMLGLCDRVLCTEDSVSMISEAATAGHRPVVLRTERRKSAVAVAGSIAALFADRGFFDETHLFGAPRFEKMISAFERRGLCRYLKDARKGVELMVGGAGGTPEDFNEARRAAEWILKRWNP